MYKIVLSYRLALDETDNRVAHSYTDLVPDGGGTYASRTAVSGGSDVSGTRHDQLEGSGDPPRSAAARVIREEVDACRDFARERVRRTRVALSDIVKLLFEIAFLGAPPDDPHRPRSGFAFLISSARRLPLPQDLFVRNHFGVRIAGLFQALLDLRSEPSVVLGALHIIPHEVAQQLRAGPVITARGLGEGLFQFPIHTEGKGGFRHDLNSRI